MKVTAVTATYERPDALRLCEKYLARQTRPPDQWLVLDGKERMQRKVLDAIDAGKIEGDVIVWFEDDDWYRPDWVSWCAEQIEKGYELVGEGHAAYYNVAFRWWSECRNVRHAALCQTAMHADLLPTLANVIRSYDWPFFDVRIWQVECGKFLALPKTAAQRRVLGIKGIRGLDRVFGYSGEHRDRLPGGARSDPSLLQLWKWVGDDAQNYSGFRFS